MDMIQDNEKYSQAVCVVLVGIAGHIQQDNKQTSDYLHDPSLQSLDKLVFHEEATVYFLRIFL